MLGAMGTTLIVLLLELNKKNIILIFQAKWFNITSDNLDERLLKKNVL